MGFVMAEMTLRFPTDIGRRRAHSPSMVARLASHPPWGLSSTSAKPAARNMRSKANDCIAVFIIGHVMQRPKKRHCEKEESVPP